MLLLSHATRLVMHPQRSESLKNEGSSRPHAFRKVMIFTDAARAPLHGLEADHLGSLLLTMAVHFHQVLERC